MRQILLLLLLHPLFLFAQRQSIPQSVKGLQQPVAIYRDSFGVNHIYAQNEHDLFFVQGYCAAKDRLFQFELWRRQASGTLSEILGPKELKRDIGARLFKYRGSLKAEFNHYHPHGVAIFSAFTDGINAFIKLANKNREALPIEFKLLGITPGYWTSDIVISRHQGLLTNLQQELANARAVSLAGSEKVKEFMNFQPGNPNLKLDSSIAPRQLFQPLIEPYEAFRAPLVFSQEDLVAHAGSQTNYLNEAVKNNFSSPAPIETSENSGSNNWVVSGKLTASGFPLLANDPHRIIAIPSLRYIVHLHAPGWNVVGGGEPLVPGVSIGHNEFGAWGLTVFNIDAEDLYVYDLNPENLMQYKYKGSWENMKTINDTIKIKNESPLYIQHHYTIHGPVTFIDSINNKAYAVRCAWLEPGSAPYLASLRMDQSKSWEDFRAACSHSNLPGENMVWADKKGNIGWQVAGIAPVRKNWSGLVPVPGDGRFEWAGFLNIDQLPHLFNPKEKFIATANENNIPKNYAYRNAVGWSWADSFRVNRIRQVLAGKKSLTAKDMQALQTDYLSLPAQTLVPLLKQILPTNKFTDSLRLALLQWDFNLNKESVNAAVYVMWERMISDSFLQLAVPPAARKYITDISLSAILRYLTLPSNIFGKDSTGSRNEFLLGCFEKAVSALQQKLGNNILFWQYGQTKYHHIYVKHILSNSLNDSLRSQLNAGPEPRGGNANTVCATGDEDQQLYGASFRIVCDLSDWDKTSFTNTPGQSGNPGNFFYKNLFPMWVNDEYKMIFFSEDKIKKSVYKKIILAPGK
ncbi:MAG: penicillin acylase family protein [Ferruginibacter sp.]